MTSVRLLVLPLFLAVLNTSVVETTRAQAVYDVDEINAFLTQSILFLTSIHEVEYEDPLTGARTAYQSSANYIFESQDGITLLNIYGFPGPTLALTWRAYAEDASVRVSLQHDDNTYGAEAVSFDGDRLVLQWDDATPPTLDIYGTPGWPIAGHRTYITLVAAIDEADYQKRIATVVGRWRVQSIDGNELPDQFLGYTFFEDGSFEEVVTDDSVRHQLPRASSGLESHFAQWGTDLQTDTLNIRALLEVDVSDLVRELATEDRLDHHFEEALAIALRSNPADFLRDETYGRSFVAYFDDTVNISMSPAYYFAPRHDEIIEDTATEAVAEFIDRRVERFAALTTYRFVDRLEDISNSLTIGRYGHLAEIRLGEVLGSFDMNSLLAQDFSIHFRLIPEWRHVKDARAALISHFDSDSDPFLEVLDPNDCCDPHIGYVAEVDLARVNALLEDPEVRAVLPPNMDLLYGARSHTRDGEQMRELLPVWGGPPELTKEDFDQVTAEFDGSGSPVVSLQMTGDAATRWEALTAANLSRHVAIIVNGQVQSYPRILGRIAGGRTQITSASRAEAAAMAALFTAEPLPAPVNIRELVVDERGAAPRTAADEEIVADTPVPDRWLISHQGWSSDLFHEGHSENGYSGSLLVLTYVNRPPVYLMITAGDDEMFQLLNVYGLWHGEPTHYRMRRD